MAKSTSHKRIFSALLTLCLTVIMLAGFIMSAPVEVKADTSRNFTIYTADINATRVDIGYGGWCGFMRTGSFVLNDGTKTYTYKLGHGTAIPLGDAYGGFTLRFTAPNWDETPVYDPTKIYTVTIKSGFIYDEQGDFPDITFTLPITSPYMPFPSSDPSLTPAGTDYYDRHYNFWFPVFTQLMAGTNNMRLTVNTDGQSLDHIQHFVFNALVGTKRTLTVIHEDETYVIRGTAESKDGKMGSILLGHNHTFAILAGYKT